MDFDRAVAELQTLVETLEREGDERALLALQLVDAIHRPAVERIAAGELDHPVVRALVELYVPDEQTAAEDALDDVREYIESHGGSVDLLGVEDGVVRVRLSGACAGCAGSEMTLRRGVEEALRAHLPGFRELVAEESVPGGIALPMARTPVFVDVAAEHDLAPGELRAVEAAGVAVLLAKHGDEVYALHNGCAVDGMPLDGARLTDEGVVICPWHNCAYDVRSGRRIDGEEGRVGVIPVALQSGAVKVAVDIA